MHKPAEGDGARAGGGSKYFNGGTGSSEPGSSGTGSSDGEGDGDDDDGIWKCHLESLQEWLEYLCRSYPKLCKIFKKLAMAWFTIGKFNEHFDIFKSICAIGKAVRERPYYLIIIVLAGAIYLWRKRQMGMAKSKKRKDKKKAQKKKKVNEY